MKESKGVSKEFSLNRSKSYHPNCKSYLTTSTFEGLLLEMEVCVLCFLCSRVCLTLSYSAGVCLTIGIQSLW